MQRWPDGDGFVWQPIPVGTAVHVPGAYAASLGPPLPDGGGHIESPPESATQPPSTDERSCVQLFGPCVHAQSAAPTSPPTTPTHRAKPQRFGSMQEASGGRRASPHGFA
jgi:hypothetical protein